MGKIIGGSVGFMLGGPLGAVAGVALGAIYDAGTAGPRVRLNSGEEAHLTYFVAAFSMLARLAKADGVVSREEISVIERFMEKNLGLDREGKRLAVRIFNQAKSSSDRFEDYAAQFYSIFQQRREIILSMFDILVAVASADGTIHPNEERMLNRAARIFHISSGQYGRIRESRTGGADKYYAVLGSSRSDTDEMIKKKYRKLASEFHPDKIISKGLPEEFTTFAKTKFQEIQEAYEKVKAERGM
ncbi:MAG: co-chaperone DjlA [Candidatus Auribacterota bacterium]|nr:co-chaperone DjlA [Candidatus Auribacterota bacterium]